MPEQSVLIDTLSYQGPERRLQERRYPIYPLESDWRISNLALIGSDRRGSLGRRGGDYRYSSGPYPH